MPILHTPEGMPYALAVDHYLRTNSDPLQPGARHAIRFMVVASSAREARSLLGSIEPLMHEAAGRCGEPIGTLEWDMPEIRQLPAQMRVQAEQLARRAARAHERLILVRAWMDVEVPGCACP